MNFIAIKKIFLLNFIKNKKFANIPISLYGTKTGKLMKILSETKFSDLTGFVTRLKLNYMEDIKTLLTEQEERTKRHIDVLKEDFDSKFDLLVEQYNSIMEILDSHSKKEAKSRGK
jgi:hypothetical protein